MGLESPKPSCVGEQAKVGERTYSVIPPPQSWICLSERDGNLVVKAHSNSGIPMVVTAQPKAAGSTSSTDVKLQSAVIVALSKPLGFTSGDQVAVSKEMSGEFEFSGAPESVVLKFEQFPALLLMSVLATAVDMLLTMTAVGFPLKEGLETLQCLGDASTAAGPGESLNGERAAKIANAFFSCVGTIMNGAVEGSAVTKFVAAQAGIALSLVSSVPGFLVSSALGLIGELTGKRVTRVTLDVTNPVTSTGPFFIDSGPVPFSVGADIEPLVKQGHLSRHYCGVSTSKTWSTLGISVENDARDKVLRVWVNSRPRARTSEVYTRKKIMLSSTFAEAQAAYPAMRWEQRDVVGNPVTVAVIPLDGQELVLFHEDPANPDRTAKPDDDDRITRMVVQPTGLDFEGDC